MCTYGKLIALVWGEEIGHVEAELIHLAYEHCQKTEAGPNEPRFLGHAWIEGPTGDSDAEVLISVSSEVIHDRSTALERNAESGTESNEI